MTGARRQSLAALAAEEAPLRPRRAAAVILAVLDEVLQTPLASGSSLEADQVVLDEHGAIHIPAVDPARMVGPDQSDPRSSELDQRGADVGRLFFLLLLGRPPRGSEDAFEPHLLSELSEDLVSLVARACSPSPGQWPDLHEWTQPLEKFAGAVSPGLPPHRRRAQRRRRLAVGIAMAALIAVTLAVLLLTPRWWDTATSDEGLGSPTPTIQW